MRWMRSSILPIGLLIAAAAGTETAHAQKARPNGIRADALQWEPLPTPPSAIVRALALTNRGAILAGSQNGLYASHDNGRSWRPFGLNSAEVESLLATKAGTILVGTYRQGLFRSVDDGASWQAVGFDRSVYLYGLVQDIDGGIYATVPFGVDSTDPTGIFRSADEGQTWSSVGLASSHVFSLSIPFPETIFAGTDSGLFVSRDRGGKWARSDMGLPTSVPVSSVVAYGKTLLAGTGMRQDSKQEIAGDGIFRSDDGGRTWTRADRGIPPHTSVRALLVFGDTLLAATGNAISGGGTGVYRSVQLGTWLLAGLKNEEVWGLARVAQGRVLAAVMDAAMFRSDDAGRNWISSGDGFDAWPTYGVAVGRDGRLYASSGKGTFTSGNGGHHWSPPPAAASPTLVRGVRGELLGAGSKGQMYRSLNEGKTWEVLTVSSQGGVIRDFDIDSGGRIYAAAWGPSGGLYESAAQGHSWHELDIRRPGVTKKWDGVMSVAVTSDGSLIAGATNGLQRSPDGTAFEIVADSVIAFALSACGRDTVFAAAYERGLLESTDNGRTWRPLTETIRAQSRQSGYLTLFSVLCLDARRILIGSYGDGAFLSEDGGLTWKSVSAGLRSSTVFAFAKGPDGSIFAATGAGIHRLKGFPPR